MSKTPAAADGKCELKSCNNRAVTPQGACADHMCSIRDCGRVVLAQGLCRPHYDRARKHRDLSEPIREYGTGGKVQIATPKLPKYVADWYEIQADKQRTTVYALVNELLVEHAHKHGAKAR